MPENTENRDLLPIRDVARRYSVCTRTLSRWAEYRPFEFPLPLMLGGTRYWRREQLEAWENSRPPSSDRKRRPFSLESASA